MELLEKSLHGKNPMKVSFKEATSSTYFRNLDYYHAKNAHDGEKESIFSLKEDGEENGWWKAEFENKG